MASTLTITNNTQNHYSTVSVLAIPIANPQDLLYTLPADAETIDGLAGSIFPTLIQDQVDPPNLYHGGNPILDSNSLEFYQCEDITITNSSTDVVSGEKKKGILELRVGVVKNITSTSQPGGADTNVELASIAHGYTVGTRVLITGLSAGQIANGIYRITSIPTANSFTIDYSPAVYSPYTGPGYVSSYNYYWDEVYTTPLGLYECWDDSTPVTSGSIFYFTITNNDSNEIKIYVEDPNIIPKVGDTLVLQRFFDNVNSYTNNSTTDGINNTNDFPFCETYSFKIEVVSPVPFVLGTPPYIEYTLTLDKSFAPIVSSPKTKYMFVLLNREGTTVDRELFTDTWKLNEIHRTQLLGDPYEYTGVTLPQGRKNYLNYGGSGFLGFKTLLSGVLPDVESPFIVLDFYDELKDRIRPFPFTFEIHIPNILLQNERGPVILNNSEPTIYDATGCGSYSGLYMKYNESLIRYGFIFYDLRIAVIDHAELATAMGYNSNRNYTLPELTLPLNGNKLAYPTFNSPANIVGITTGVSTIVQTNIPHQLRNGDAVFIFDALQTPNAISINSTITLNTNSNAFIINNSIPFYVKEVVGSFDKFQLYYDLALTSPVDTTGEVYLGAGKMASYKLPYEYFATYRLKGVHYDCLPYSIIKPFNFQNANVIDNRATSDGGLGTVGFEFEKLTYLVDSLNLEGYEADEYEIIIGKYIKDLVDVTKISGIEEVVVMPVTSQNSLKNLNIQLNTHTSSYSISDLETQISMIGGINDPSYDLYNVMPIYNVPSLPTNLFAGEGAWLLGNVQYQQSAKQFKLTFTVVIKADKWNGTMNPTYEAGNLLMKEKLISEVAFVIQDALGNHIAEPYVYAKIAPVLRKTNQTDITLDISIDF